MYIYWTIYVKNVNIFVLKCISKTNICLYTVKPCILYWLLKWYVKKCISKGLHSLVYLKPGVLMNNKCKNSKKINIYIEYLKWYVKKYISKSIMFACISLTCVLIK